ncbi:MAG: hypothetical protein ACAH83_19805 [Alphaproteobacteria bacterium]
MFFATRQKLNQMTDAALDSRKGTFKAVKKLGEALAGGSIGGGILFGMIALLSNASKIMVAIAFGAGAVVPIVAGVVTVLFAGVELSRVEDAQSSRPRPAAKTRAPKAKPAAAAAPAVTNAPDLSDAFHAGVDAKVSAMKPLRFKRQPDQTRVM